MTGASVSIMCSLCGVTFPLGGGHHCQGQDRRWRALELAWARMAVAHCAFCEGTGIAPRRAFDPVGAERPCPVCQELRQAIASIDQAMQGAA